MRTIPISVLIVSSALLVNVLLSIFEGPSWAVISMFVAGPFLMVWMVLHVLRDDSVEVRDLENDEEWGYQDRPDLRPVKHS
jgi:hypothetical protein